MQSTPFGFRYQSRQPNAILSLRLGVWSETSGDEAPAIFDRIDAWLERTLGAPVPAAPSTAPSSAARETFAFQLAWRALVLGQAVRAGGAEPVFEPGRPLALLRPGPQAPTESVTVRASVAAPMRGTTETLESIYQRCGELLLRLSRTPIGTQSRRAVLGELAALAKQASRDTGGLGKSTFQALKGAWGLDVPFAYLGEGAFQLGWGARSIRIDRSVTAADSAIGARLSQNKASSCALLAQAGLPVPTHQLVRNAEDAEQAANALGWPVVVKPANRDRGEGVTIGIASGEALRAAYEAARKLSPQVLVERQVAGVCHRIFIAQGEVLYAVRRDPKSVFGDGSQTVAQLIEAANLANLALPFWDRVEAWPADALTVTTLAAQGLGMESVPARGQKVALRPIESTRWGGDDEDMSELIHPENARLAVEAARLLGLSNAGIDLMSVDISQPWYQNGAVINEVNFAPTLGAAEISKRHVPEFIRRHVDGDGRIPVHVVIGTGEAAEDAARSVQKRLERQGLRCWITDAQQTIDQSGEIRTLTANGLFARVQALLLNRTVDALMMVVEDDSLLASGLPVDRITEVIEVGGDERSDGSESNSEPARRRLIRLLRGYTGRGRSAPDTPAADR